MHMYFMCAQELVSGLHKWQGCEQQAKEASQLIQLLLTSVLMILLFRERKALGPQQPHPQMLQGQGTCEMLQPLEMS